MALPYKSDRAACAARVSSQRGSSDHRRDQRHDQSSIDSGDVSRRIHGSLIYLVDMHDTWDSVLTIGGEISARWQLI